MEDFIMNNNYSYEEEPMSFLLTCQQCKKQFSGDPLIAKYDATLHAVTYEHSITGEERHFISIDGRR